MEQDAEQLKIKNHISWSHSLETDNISVGTGTYLRKATIILLEQTEHRGSFQALCLMAELSLSPTTSACFGEQANNTTYPHCLPMQQLHIFCFPLPLSHLKVAPFSMAEGLNGPLRIEHKMEFVHLCVFLE